MASKLSKIHVSAGLAFSNTRIDKIYNYNKDKNKEKCASFFKFLEGKQMLVSEISIHWMTHSKQRRHGSEFKDQAVQFGEGVPPKPNLIEFHAAKAVSIWSVS